MSLLILSSALALVANPAATPSGSVSNGGATPPAPTESTSNPAPVERQICRRVEANTGSRLVNARRVCMTAREWREFERGN